MIHKVWIYIQHSIRYTVPVPVNTNISFNLVFSSPSSGLSSLFPTPKPPKNPAKTLMTLAVLSKWITFFSKPPAALPGSTAGIGPQYDKDWCFHHHSRKESFWCFRCTISTFSCDLFWDILLGANRTSYRGMQVDVASLGAYAKAKTCLHERPHSSPQYIIYICVYIYRDLD